MKKGATIVSDIDENGRRPLRLDYPQTIKVGLAFAIILVFWTAYDFVVPLLLEQAYGLSNMMRGLIMGLDNLLSLFMLPLFGRFSDKANGKIAKKHGRRTPFIVVGTLLSVALMVLVPISAQKQLNASTEIRNTELSKIGDDIYMSDTLNMFYGNSKYCDMNYLKINNISKEQFVAIRFDSKLTSKSGFMGIGGTDYTYDGKEVALSDTLGDGRSVQSIVDMNKSYDKFVKAGMNTYISEKVENVVITTKAGITSLSVYMVVLFFVLMAMATFRSPAVALMPDVTPKPLRSQANAMINLVGGIGGALAFLIYTVVLFGKSLSNYTIIFGAVAAVMLLLLAAFLALVKERKLVDKCQKTCEDYGITDEENEQAELDMLADEVSNDILTVDANVAHDMIAEEEFNQTDMSHKAEELSKADEFSKRVDTKFNLKYAHLSAGERKVKLEKAKKLSFFLILASIFMWFMGYNAVSSNLSIYCVKALNLNTGVASIISGVSMGVSALAFIPVGMLAVRIGRRKSIMIGFALAVLSFILIYTPLISMAEIEVAKAAVFAVFYLIAGFGLIIANVNTFPMVVELARSEDVGKYTGFYYAATMSAQAITPFIAGAIMDKWGSNTLFIYAAICIVGAIAIMCFVKFGDSSRIPKSKKFSNDEKPQVLLDAID